MFFREFTPSYTLSEVQTVHRCVDYRWQGCGRRRWRPLSRPCPGICLECLRKRTKTSTRSSGGVSTIEPGPPPAEHHTCPEHSVPSVHCTQLYERVIVGQGTQPGKRRKQVLSTTPRPLYFRKRAISYVREAGWSSGPV